MAIVLQNSNYNGEVLEQLLTIAATGNELVEKGLIHIEPQVSYKFSIPRLKSGSMLQKRKEQPVDGDSKGDFKYSEKVLQPQEFMAFTTFNPRSFEKIWRQWQPKGQLVFAELTPEAQNALLAQMAKQVNFELGYYFIQGIEGTGDNQLFNGIVTRMMSDNDTIKVTTSETTMIGKLGALKTNIPVTLRNNPNLRILCSIKDFDKYDVELKAQQYKGANYTDQNPERFGGIIMVPLSNWPDDLLIATICGMDIGTNLWAAVNLVDDMNVIQIDKLTNSGERYFFKMLMKADTQIAFGEECIILDTRSGGGDPDSIVADPQELIFDAAGESQEVEIVATSAYTIGTMPTGFTAVKSENGITVTASANTGVARNGTFDVTLIAANTVKVTISVAQEAGA